VLLKARNFMENEPIKRQQKQREECLHCKSSCKK